MDIRTSLRVRIGELGGAFDVPFSHFNGIESCDVICTIGDIWCVR